MLGDASLVWIENESFGFDVCASATAPSADDASAALAGLRARASAGIDEALRTGGVALGGRQFMTLTPVSGSLACGGLDSQATFRVAAVDRGTGKFWSDEMTVRGDAPDHAALTRLADHLARHFGAATTTAAVR
jgi:hypothetical protein